MKYGKLYKIAITKPIIFIKTVYLIYKEVRIVRKEGKYTWEKAIKIGVRRAAYTANKKAGELKAKYNLAVRRLKKLEAQGKTY